LPSSIDVVFYDDVSDAPGKRAGIDRKAAQPSALVETGKNVPFILNSTEVDERDRQEFVHTALGMTMVPIDLYWPKLHDGVKARGVITDVGDLTVCTGQTTAYRVERTPRLARDAMEPSIFVNLQHFGSGMVVQHDREAVGHPGDLVMYDSTAPYTLLNETGMTGDFFRIPHSALALPHDMIRDACAVNLSPGHPITSLTHDYLRRLAADPALSRAANADLVGRPTIELIRAVIITHLRADEYAAEPMAATQQLRILEYARAHLSDPDLSAEQIAEANFMSVRHLYKVLSRSGISLAEWIRTRRLEACRKDLTDAPHTTTISTIARRHGFTDMSSFSRSFRAEYGVTPSEWRDRELRSRRTDG
jgi:AraC-like DNA-binding protein